MDISIRNGIVLENILPYVEDITTVMRLSAVCKRWYELLNTDTVLWNRLLNLEQIEDPQYWNRADDNDEWTLGTPCTPKNILINYRKTYYYIKHNIYKKYVFECDDNNVFEYNGKTLIFTKDWVLHIHKIINNNLQLFQTIDLTVYCSSACTIRFYCNEEFIVIIIIASRNMITYRLIGSEYVYYNQLSVDKPIRYQDSKGKLLDSGVFVYGRYNLVIACNIPDNRIIFNAANNEFIKHDRGIVYIRDIEHNQLVLYNEEFEIIYRVDIVSRVYKVFDVISNEKLLAIVYYKEGNGFSVTICDKATGQIRLGSKDFFRNNYPKVLLLNNNNIIGMSRNRDESIDCYDGRFQLLWSHQTPSSGTLSNLYYYCIFNRLLILKYNCKFRDTKRPAYPPGHALQQASGGLSLLHYCGAAGT
ncbi:hypothetical protein O3M35_010933 [Rhynocoris fuscipes]|uniref:F-box domain-containing protein n=1 Tax=Rhynocoris fuscipes TaxID=488301 RepID=A0AAW1D1S2_9HEMI